MYPSRAAAQLFAQLEALLADAAVSKDAAEAAVAAVSAARTALRQRRPRGLPQHERDVWARAGALFDEQAVPIAEAASAAAFVDLVARSFRGDAAVADVLGVDRSRVSQRLADRSLYAFAGPGEDRHFPAWQFVEGRTLPGLKAVLSVIDSGRHPLSVDHFFIGPNINLEVAGALLSPAAWLALGGPPAAVVDLAADL